MINKNSIPDADQFWPAAEKVLDQHFRKRRIVMWLLSILVPAFIAGVLLVVHHSENNVVENMNAAVSPGQPAVASSSLDSDSPSLLHSHSNSHSNSHSHPNKSPSSQPLASVNSASILPVTGASESLTVDKYFPDDNSTTPFKSNDDNNSINNSTNSSLNNNLNTSSLPSENRLFNSSDQISKSEFEQLVMLYPLKSAMKTNQRSFDAATKYFSVKPTHTCNHQLGYELTVYGSANYIQKSVSGGSEFGSYLQHRKNEEDAVLLPAFGAALSANAGSLSLSIGVEYSTYGEKTNYYPYSNQSSVININRWDTFTVQYLQTDTAYITGNQLFMQTLVMRHDSAYNLYQGTVEEYKYDKKIADENGVNRITYIEIPVEVSYYVTRGRAGIGVSGGVAPAFLSSSDGHYIRTDGRGIVPIDELPLRKFVVNGRASVDFYYRLSGRTKIALRPQYRMNL